MTEEISDKELIDQIRLYCGDSGSGSVTISQEKMRRLLKLIETYESERDTVSVVAEDMELRYIDTRDSAEDLVNEALRSLGWGGDWGIGENNLESWDTDGREKLLNDIESLMKEVEYSQTERNELRDSWRRDHEIMVERVNRLQHELDTLKSFMYDMYAKQGSWIPSNITIQKVKKKEEDSYTECPTCGRMSLRNKDHECFCQAECCDYCCPQGSKHGEAV